MAVKIPQPNASVLAARERRASRAGQDEVRIDWFIENIASKVAISLKNRIRIAGQYLQSRIVKKLSVPVVWGTGPDGGRVVIERSKPGEYPRAETTQLLKTIFHVVNSPYKDVWDVHIGTPLDYGVILETRMRRSFLVRTLNREYGRLRGIVSGPLK